MKQKENLGFIINFSHLRWLGGSNYFLNLFNSVSQYKNYSITIFTGIDKKKFHPEIKKKYKIVYLKILDPKLKINILKNYFRFFLLIFFKRDFLLESKLSKFNINILSHSQPIGRKSSIKSIYWIPDLQEILFKKFFTIKARYRRWFDHYLAINNSSVILFSSKSVQSLFQSNYNIPKKKLRILQFPTKLPNKIYFKKELANYKNFFLISNQFWLHKNYEVVIKALVKLKKNNLFPNVVCTGSKKDWRSNIYFNDLSHEIKKNKLNHFVILGSITREDQMYLMRNCTALINPSKSEGWNTAIEEAKALNKNIIASNLQVHTEQIGRNGNFFHPDDYIELSLLIKKYYKMKKISLTPYKKLLINNRIAFKKFSSNYVNILKDLNL